MRSMVFVVVVHSSERVFKDIVRDLSALRDSLRLVESVTRAYSTAQMAPAGIDPPITTPAPGTPLPVHPAQPSLQGDCVGNRSAKKSSKKGKAKGAGKKKILKPSHRLRWWVSNSPPSPSGISKRDGEQTGNTGPSACPSGISRK